VKANTADNAPNDYGFFLQNLDRGIPNLIVPSYNCYVINNRKSYRKCLGDMDIETL